MSMDKVFMNEQHESKRETLKMKKERFVLLLLLVKYSCEVNENWNIGHISERVMTEDRFNLLSFLHRVECRCRLILCLFILLYCAMLEYYVKIGVVHRGICLEYAALIWWYRAVLSVSMLLTWIRHFSHFLL